MVIPPGKGSGIRQWALVKWPRAPVSVDLQETCFESVSKGCSVTDTFHVHSQLCSPESWREPMNCHPGHCMAACRGPYYEGKGPSAFSMLGWNWYHIMVWNGTVFGPWHIWPEVMRGRHFWKNTTILAPNQIDSFLMIGRARQDSTFNILILSSSKKGHLTVYVGFTIYIKACCKARHKSTCPWVQL